MNPIKAIRQKLALTQSELAVGMGCTQGNVAAYEARDQEVPPSKAARLIEFAAGKGLAVSFDDIYRRHLSTTNTKSRTRKGAASAPACSTEARGREGIRAGA